MVAAPGGAVAADAPVAASTIPVGAGAGAAGAGAAGGADGHGMVFFMHDILGGTNPSARIVAGIVDNAAVTGQGDTSLLPLSEIVVPAEGLRLAALLTAAGLTSSNSEANRKLKERAVKIDAVVVEDAQRVFEPGFEGVLQVGKRSFARVLLKHG